jgi:putative ABC transport system ATP-binding protein
MMIDKEEVKMIQLNNIIKRYKRYGKKRVLVFNNITKTFSDEGMVFIVGEKSSGKTTFLNILAGLDKLSFGNIYVNQKILSFDEIHDVYKYRQNQVSYIFSGNNMSSVKTVWKVIKDILKKKQGLKQVDQMVFDLLRKLDILHLKHKFQFQLTFKESQKVGLAIALAKDTPILLIDEPQFEILDTLKELSVNKLVIATTTNEELAKAFATRVIFIENEKMDRDQLISTNEVYHQEDKSIPIPKSNPLMKMNMFHFAKKALLTLFLTLSLVFSLYIASINHIVNQFDTYDTLIETTEASSSYVMPIYKYQERAFTYGWSFIIRAGTFDYPQDVRESYRELIEEKADHQLPVYASYFFNKNFQDFFDVNLSDIGLSQVNKFRSLHFTEVILVDDFDSFNEPLLMGFYPSSPNEILIYDYMAEQIVTSGVDQLEDFSDLLYYDLVDRDTSLTMTISGILRSQYGDYRYIDSESTSKIIPEKTYLQSLQSIYAFPDLMNQVNLEKDMFSVHQVKIQDYLDQNVESSLEFRKIGYINDIEDYQLIGDKYPFHNGIYISKHQLAEMLGVDPSIIDDQFVNSLALYTSYTFEISSFYYDYSYNKSSVNKVYLKILGVYDSDSLDLNTLYTHLDARTRYPSNGNLRRFYLGLDLDWELNKQVLEAFKVPDSKSFVFFYENLEYSTDDFGIYSAHRLMSEETRYKVYEIQNDYLIYTIVSIGTLILSTLVFTLLFIPLNQSKIHIERMLGRSNLLLVTKYSIEVALISLIGLSIAYFPIFWKIESIKNNFLELKPYLHLNLTVSLFDTIRVFIWIFPIFFTFAILNYAIRLTLYPLIRNRKDN